VTNTVEHLILRQSCVPVGTRTVSRISRFSRMIYGRSPSF
jgi:hypothetical protein